MGEFFVAPFCDCNSFDFDSFGNQTIKRDGAMQSVVFVIWAVYNR